MRSHLENPTAPSLQRRLQTLFRLLKASQLSLEMDCGGLRAAVVVETLKLAIRLLLLVLQQNRTLLVEVMEGTECALNDGAFIGERTGLRLPPMRTMPTASVAVHKSIGLNFALPYPEDCLMILRPLVYLAACAWLDKRRGGGRNRALQQWEPWAIASGMDIIGVLILRERLRKNMVEPGDPRAMEYRRRTRAMVMGMVRERNLAPFYSLDIGL